MLIAVISLIAGNIYVMNSLYIQTIKHITHKNTYKKDISTF